MGDEGEGQWKESRIEGGVEDPTSRIISGCGQTAAKGAILMWPEQDCPGSSTPEHPYALPLGHSNTGSSSPDTDSCFIGEGGGPAPLTLAVQMAEVAERDPSKGDIQPKRDAFLC